ncbi:GNAT family N-acetyltransferase [Clostridium sp. C2-6-12]|uniref:GNAT family N-acetyltransferase n=1 Tax=Clostridium sp. C2-6-12 TaxID=2698832 RepID=UPI00136EAA91|nr:GNAT family N-acetyltransferase [Clostridium sp. C2-6-12]
MSKYLFQQVRDDYFSTHYGIYGTNIYMNIDWKEVLESCAPKGNGTLIFKDSVPIGGIIIHNNHFSSPFLIPPFCHTEEFWHTVINYSKKNSKNEILYFDNIPESHVDALISLGATKRWAERRMYRPTAEFKIKLNDDFYFTTPKEIDKDEIIQVVYEAHLNGHTFKVYGDPGISYTEGEINRRFVLFSQTNTLHFGTIVKTKDTNKIIAVCIAGIYPDSQNNFSTINQVSVLPEYRRQGIAQAMMMNSINIAHTISPVIGLGVLVGNPAELLYKKLGFIEGPPYFSLTYEKLV